MSNSPLSKCEYSNISINGPLATYAISKKAANLNYDKWGDYILSLKKLAKKNDIANA